jgi:hypothetical protein
MSSSASVALGSLAAHLPLKFQISNLQSFPPAPTGIRSLPPVFHRSLRPGEAAETIIRVPLIEKINTRRIFIN